MAQMVDVVALSHYVNEPKAFAETLPAGTILTLSLEPENYHNPNAIAVYNGEDQIGYITDGDIEVAMDELFKDDAKSVLVRYDGSHSDKSLSLDVNQLVKVTSFKETAITDPFEGKTPLPYSKAPLILKEERQILHWANQIDIDTRVIIKRLPNDNVAMALAEEITTLLDKYIPLADFSLSAECFTTITNVHHRLVNLMMIPEYKTKYEAKLKLVTEKRDNFIHKKGLDKIFTNQLTLLTERLEEKGFFEDIANAIFDDPENPDDSQITSLANNIKEWLRLTPLKAANFRTSKPQKFVELLYEARLNYMDLYMVYTNIILLNSTKDLFAKWVDNGRSTPKTERHERIIKVIGRIQDLILE